VVDGCRKVCSGVDRPRGALEPAARTDTEERPAAHRPRAVLNGVLWVLRTGAPWKDLPPRYPPYQTSHRWFQRWSKGGTMELIVVALARLERIYDRDGLEFPRSTVCAWHLALADLLAPLLDTMWLDAFEARTSGGADLCPTRRRPGARSEEVPPTHDPLPAHRDSLDTQVLLFMSSARGLGSRASREDQRPRENARSRVPPTSVSRRRRHLP
jgi:transposase